LAKSLPRPIHDHLYWAGKASEFNTQKEREDFLREYGFEEKRIETITHLAVAWLPQRMYMLSNRLLNLAYHDLPNDTARTMFRVGIHSYKKKKGLL